ncbi:MAG: YqeG family HAD IIIA-type phosphatase [Anaeroplasmataceae bacterium]|nr:YqeG family HAD IIIA-type phosphatase [Anaeroplasmataceae bacterium]
MLKKLIPNDYYRTIEDIPYNKLYAEGFRLILTDLDNTLISYLEKEPTEELFKWKNMVESIGFEIIIVSNSRKDRVEHFANLLNLPFVKFAKKPLLFGMKKAFKMAKKEYKKEEILEIGDQLMTDVFASRRLGVHTILVKAIDKKTEILPTKINRKLEHFFLNQIERRHPRLYQQKLDQYVVDKNE